MYNLDLNANPSCAMSFVFKSKNVILFLTRSKCVNSWHASTSYAGFLAGNQWLRIHRGVGLCLQQFGRWPITRAWLEHSTSQINVGEGLSLLVIIKKKSSAYKHPMKKLRKLAFDLKNSPTILLPAWYKILAIHCLSPHMMPHDVSTCWNLTFNMLEFTI